MQDQISKIIRRYDFAGQYLDTKAMNKVASYFQNAMERLQVVQVLQQDAVDIIKEASNALFTSQPELLRPSGNAYTTRRYAACLRDLEYYLRYAIYAILAGDMSILNERVLTGLADTYNSLGVPIGPTIIGINQLKEAAKKRINSPYIDEVFDHMIKNLC
jgi:phycobilisome core component|uniref:Allophycocyanin B18 chain n=1 Tax=Cyanidioschyzon merolae TaxID=45157 RepID=A0A5P9RTA3_CYAME|nr:allophycocyanin B18 chain [Cyanidioschyzon merolae]QFV17124.1 allophycocyanin B18 chain [Cyanidioschyzon merolae]